ncbi:MAG: amino acid adenylation domain-containing protein [Saccharothrix sp.]|nr:amino acid adenylation domain-containing protein [Saccharothrix sp.]
MDRNGGTGIRSGAVLPDIVTSSAHRFGDRPALVFDHGSLTYRDFASCVDALAHALVRAGMAPGQRVALCCRRGPLVPIAIAAVVRLGCAYVPLDPGYPAERLRFLLADAGVHIALCDDAGSAALTGADVPTIGITPDVLDARHDGSGLPALPVCVDPAYVIYTSGSSGFPKGVEVSHDNVVALLEGLLPLFDDGPQTWPLQHSPVFDVSVWELWGGLASGATLLVTDEHTARDAELLAELLVRGGATVLHVVASVFRHLADVVSEERLQVPLRRVVFAGERINVSALEVWERSQLVLPAWYNLYGPTETTVYSSANEVTVAGLRGGPRPDPIGYPLPHAPTAVLDDALRPVAPGEVGELVIGGRHVALGYVNRPELTAERFTTVPGREGTWYRSGDLGVADADGLLYFVGRRDGQVKVHGIRVELGEVEYALRRLDLVRDAAVVVRDSARGEAMLIACVVVAPGLDAVESLPEQVVSALRAVLPEHLVPHRVDVVDDLPRTIAGKLDRAALLAG